MNEFSVHEYETAAQEPKILLSALHSRFKLQQAFSWTSFLPLLRGKKKPPHSVTLERFRAKEISVKWEGEITTHFHMDHGSGITARPQTDAQRGPWILFFIFYLWILYPFPKHIQVDRVVHKLQKEHCGKEEFLGIIMARTLLLCYPSPKTKPSIKPPLTNFHLRSLC